MERKKYGSRRLLAQHREVPDDVRWTIRDDPKRERERTLLGKKSPVVVVRSHIRKWPAFVGKRRK
jgi:hypothetical protein